MYRSTRKGFYLVMYIDTTQILDFLETKEAGSD